MFEPTRTPLSEERLQRLRLLLAAAVRQPVAEQQRFLRQSCADDEQLTTEALALLDEHTESFMARPLPELLGATPPSRQTLPPGLLLKNRYRLQDEQLPGGSASVYLAADETLRGKRVIVKVLDRVHDEQISQELFEAELESLARVRHPNVVGISDVGALDDGTQFLVLDLVPGPTLRALLQAGPLPPQAADSILEGLARGLAAAHRAGVCHLDIKPENIIVSDPGSATPHAVLLDFGISQPNGRAALHRSAGTPGYTAPEPAEPVSPGSDAYSLALVAFEMLTGRLPDRGTSIELQLPKGTNSATAKAFARALHSDSAQRFPDVTAFASAWQARRRSGFAQAALALGTLAAAAALPLWFAWAGRGPTYSPPKPLVTARGVNRYPAFTPNGEYIYYTTGPEGNQDIFRKKLRGGEPEPVVVDPASDFLPTIPTGGKHLLFARREGQLLLRRDLATGSDLVLARNLDVTALSTSLDGQLAVASVIVECDLPQLHLVSLADGKTERLLIPGSPACGLHFPQVSPNGKTLAFSCSWTQASHDLYLVSVDSALRPQGNARRITNQQQRIASLAWVPDGRSLLFVAGALGDGRLYRVSTDGESHPEPVSKALEHIDTIAVPRHSWMLAYSLYLSDANLWHYDTISKRSHRYFDGPAEDEEAYPSPDGKQLLFVSTRAGTAQVWLAQSDGTAPRQLTRMESPDVISAIWSLDSREAIVSVRLTEHNEQIYRVPVQGPSTPILLVDGGFATSLSRDGRRLYYSVGRGPTQSIWRTGYPQATMKQLVVDRGAFAIESNDARSIYFSKRQENDGLWQQPLPTGPARQVIPKLHHRNLVVLGRDGIFYIAPLPGAPFPALFFQHFRSGEPQRLVSFDREIGWGLGLSSNEQRIYFTQEDTADSDIGVIERFR